MLTQTTAITPIVTKRKTYANAKNARFSRKANIEITVQQRWEDTYNESPAAEQTAIDYALQYAIFEFRQRFPDLKSWDDLAKLLALAQDVTMLHVKIDSTMQRQLKIGWVIDLLNHFCPVSVVPIHVYQPDPTKTTYLAWDGQHTAALLWVIATYIFEVDPKDVKIPVCIYQSASKPDMRKNTIDLNTKTGKNMFDQFDTWEQMVYAIRVDQANNAEWRIAEQKQQVLEKYNLFMTKKVFGDEQVSGAISRMQEFSKLDVQSLDWVCSYLVAAGAQHRPVDEKEMVMMSYFFERCQSAKINVTDQYIYSIARIASAHWGADFKHTSKFWIKVSNAYTNWHHAVINNGAQPMVRKEPIHGYPFLLEQFKKDLPTYAFPDNRTSSDFCPAIADLF